MKSKRKLLKLTALAILLSIYPLSVLTYTWTCVFRSDLEGGRHGPLKFFNSALSTQHSALSSNPSATSNPPSANPSSTAPSTPPTPIKSPGSPKKNGVAHESGESYLGDASASESPVLQVPRILLC